MRSILFYISVFCCCYACPAYAQRPLVDSLEKLLTHTSPSPEQLSVYLELSQAYQVVDPDSTRHYAAMALPLAQVLHNEDAFAESLKLTGLYYNSIASYDSANWYLEKSLAIYRKNNNESGIASVVNNLGVVKFNTGQYHEAINLYQRSLALREKNGELKGVAMCYNNIGNANMSQGDLRMALNNYLNGLRVRELLHDESGIATSLSNLGNVSYMLGDLDNAFAYYQRGMELSRKLGDKAGVINTLINIGAGFYGQQKYAEARLNFNEALRMARSINDQLSMTICLSNLAQSALEERKYPEAMRLYSESLEIAHTIGDTEGIAAARLGIGNTYLRTARSEESLPYLLKAYELAESMNAKPLRAEAATSLSVAYANEGRFDHAYHYQQVANTYRDSLLMRNDPRRLSELQADYELSQKQNEISLLEKDKQLHEKRARIQLFISISLTLIIGLSILMIVMLFRSRRKTRLQSLMITRQKNALETQASKLAELNTLKDKTFSILSHDLRSPIAALNNTMMLLDEQLLTPEEFGYIKTELTRQLDALNLVLDNLLHWSRLQIQGQSIAQPVLLPIRHITEQNINLLRAQANNKAITIENTILDGMAAHGDKDQIGIVVRNLISNAIKFTPPNGRIHISAETTNQFMEVSVKDSGIGMSDAQLRKLFIYQSHFSERGTSGEKGTGLGLLLCKDFVEQNGGHIFIVSAPGEGSTVRFTLPLQA
jgi:signal transduction histidine kinase/Tfp pilus assembly protein PilF